MLFSCFFNLIIKELPLNRGLPLFPHRPLKNSNRFSIKNPFSQGSNAGKSGTNSLPFSALQMWSQKPKIRPVWVSRKTFPAIRALFCTFFPVSRSKKQGQKTSIFPPFCLHWTFQKTDRNSKVTKNQSQANVVWIAWNQVYFRVFFWDWNWPKNGSQCRQTWFELNHFTKWSKKVAPDIFGHFYPPILTHNLRGVFGFSLFCATHRCGDYIYIG